MRIVFPDVDSMEHAGFQSIAHVPFLIDDNGNYLDAANRYLRERALAEWTPRLRINQQDEEAQAARYLTRQTCKVMAKQLRYLFSWCDASGRDWRLITYTEDLIFNWQHGLLKGKLSPSGKPLSAQTVNARISEATYFLVWAQERGLRGPVRVQISAKTSGHKQRKGYKSSPTQRTVRAGALPTPPAQLRLPTPKRVGAWLHAVSVRKGAVKGLCCETIISTGVRLAECIKWKVDTLPPRDEWEISDGEVEITLRFGCKGPKKFPDSDEAARPRNILMPVCLAERLEHYRNYQRPRQLQRWVQSAKSASERAWRERQPHPRELWLGERSNRPFSGSQLYQSWVGVLECPRGWHPHVGREFYAVERLVAHTRGLMQSHGTGAVPGLDWLYGVMASQVRIILQPVMGHVSEDTTYIYLRAVRSRLAAEVGHPAMRWQDYCGDGAEIPPSDE